MRSYYLVTVLLLCIQKDSPSRQKKQSPMEKKSTGINSIVREGENIVHIFPRPTVPQCLPFTTLAHPSYRWTQHGPHSLDLQDGLQQFVCSLVPFPGLPLGLGHRDTNGYLKIMFYQKWPGSNVNGPQFLGVNSGYSKPNEWIDPNCLRSNLTQKK